MRTGLKFLSQALASFVLIAGLIVLVFGVVVPRVAGATTYAVLANSMAPRYPTGTLMVVRPADTISIGDVITYQITPADPTVVTHRVVEIGKTIAGDLRFVTRGDANEATDPFQVMPEQIHGKLWYAIPFAGFLVVALNGWREHATLAAVGLLMAYAVWQVIRFALERNKVKKENRNVLLVQFDQLAAEVDLALAELAPVEVRTGTLIEPIVPVAQTVPTVIAPPVFEQSVFVSPVRTMPEPTVIAAINADLASTATVVNPYLPTMTRAERRRREAEFALTS